MGEHALFPTQCCETGCICSSSDSSPCCGRKGICTVLDIRVLFLAAGEREGLLGEPLLRLDAVIQDDKAQKPRQGATAFS